MKKDKIVKLAGLLGTAAAHDIFPLEVTGSIFAMITDSEEFNKVVNTVSPYLDKERDAFFASLDEERCDYISAKRFCITYKIYAVALELLANNTEVSNPEIVK